MEVVMMRSSLALTCVFLEHDSAMLKLAWTLLSLLHRFLMELRVEIFLLIKDHVFVFFIFMIKKVASIF